MAVIVAACILVTAAVSALALKLHLGHINKNSPQGTEAPTATSGPETGDPEATPDPFGTDTRTEDPSATPDMNVSSSAPLWRRYEAVPSIVCSARRRAASGGRPRAAPPSAMACSMNAKKAGPLPESAVTASKWRSSSTTVRPAASRIFATFLTSAGVALRAGQMAHMPSFARSARLGITRTRRTLRPSALRRVAIDFPAAMETTSVLSVRIGFTSAASAARSCGRTARNTTCASRATSRASGVVRTPYFFAISAARAGTFSAISTAEGSNPGASDAAARMPSAILPAPKKPSFAFMASSIS